MTVRTTRDALEDHLRLRQAGNLDADLDRNHAPDEVVLFHFGVFHGPGGVRGAARLLGEPLPPGTHHHQNVLDAREIGFLEWSATAEGAHVSGSYQVRDGRIVAQAIHSSVDTSS